MRTVLIVVVIAAIGIVGWLFYRHGYTPPLEVSGFIEADEIRVGSRVGGRVAEVLVAEGDVVKPGDVLFRVEPFDLQARLSQAKAQLAAAQAELSRLKAGYRIEEVEQTRARRDRLAATLAKLVAGPRPAEIQIAEQSLQLARANMELADIEQKRLTPLVAGRTASQNELDRANRDVKAAEANRIAAEQHLALLKEGTRSEELAEGRAALTEADAALKLMEAGYRKQDIDQAAAKVAAAEADVAVTQTQVDELVVKSPAACVVEAVDLRPGDLVAPNGPTIALLDTSRVWVRTYVPENQLGRVKLGQRVPVRVDSFPGQRFSGTVTFLATQAEFTPRNIQTPEERSKQVFRAKITLDPSDKLRVGMMADVLLEEAVR